MMSLYRLLILANGGLTWRKINTIIHLALLFFLFALLCPPAHAVASLASGNPHQLSKFIANPANLALRTVYQQQESLYSVQTNFNGSFKNPSSFTDLTRELDRLLSAQSVNIDSLNEVQDSFNNYINNNDYQIRINSFNNAQLVLPLLDNNLQLGIHSQIVGSQQLVSQQGFKVNNADVDTLIFDALTNSTINGTAFINAIDADTGFLSNLVQVNTLYFAQEFNWTVKRQLKFSLGVRTKFTQLTLAETIWPLQNVYNDYLESGDRFSVENFLTATEGLSNSKDYYSINLDIGTGFFTPNTYVGIYVLDAIEQSFNYIQPSDSCATTQQCEFANKHYSNRQNQLLIQPQLRGEISYLSGHQLYYAAMLDLQSRQDYAQQKNQYLQLTVGTHSSLYNNTRLLGYANPSISLSYLQNLKQEENLYSFRVSLWHVHVELGLSGTLLNLSSTEINRSNDQVQRLYLGVTYSNSY